MIRLLFPVILVLAGCQSTSGQVDRDCGADALDARSGAPLAELDLARHPGPVRIIRPWQVVTQDFDADRLNVVLTPGDRLDGAYCG